ncbi:MAG: elongation factor Ts [Chitinivibrionales bacterium]|nr:elongation factor Ts [Chitinivibrionales bacterium]
MAITAAEVKTLREKTGLGMMQCKKALQETEGDIEKAIENLRKQGQATAAKRAGRSAREGKVTILIDGANAVMYEVNSETDFVARNEDFLKFVEDLGPALLNEKPADITAALALKPASFEGKSVEQRIVEDLIGKIGEKITFSRFEHIAIDPATEKIFSYIHGNGRIGVIVTLASDNAEALIADAVAELGKDIAMQIAASRPLAIDRDTAPEEIVAKEKEIYTEQVKNSGKPEKIWDKIIEGKLNKFFKENLLIEQEFIRDTDKSVTDRIKEASKACGADLSVRWFARYELGEGGEEETEAES